MLSYTTSSATVKQGLEQLRDWSPPPTDTVVPLLRMNTLYEVWKCVRCHGLTTTIDMLTGPKRCRRRSYGAASRRHFMSHIPKHETPMLLLLPSHIVLAAGADVQLVQQAAASYEQIEDLIARPYLDGLCVWDAYFEQLHQHGFPNQPFHAFARPCLIPKDLNDSHSLDLVTSNRDRCSEANWSEAAEPYFVHLSRFTLSHVVPFHVYKIE